MILWTARLSLLRFNTQDWGDVYKYGCDPAAVTYMDSEPEMEGAKKEFIRRLPDYRDEPAENAFNFALLINEDSQLIGACCLRLKDVDNIREGTLSFILNRRCRNRGYMTEAVMKIVVFGFGELGLHRISATCDPANIASCRVLEKTGLKRQATPANDKPPQGEHDTALYSILAIEYATERLYSGG